MGSNASKTRRVSSSVDDTRILSIPHQHSNEHINLLVEGLVSLRDNCTFCDAIICAFDPDSKEQRKHYTHKCVLAASSGYFREKLGATLPADACSSTMESPVSNETSQTDTATNTSTVILGFPIRTAALEVVLKYMYSAVLDSRLELIPDVLEAAMKLKIASLKRRCLFEIQKEFRLEYFQRIYRLSCQLGISELRDFTLEQAIEKFDRFVDTACFLELTGAEMQELANHRSGFLPNTSVIPELQLFDAILIWEAHNHPDRKDSALKLLKCVHYQKIPQSTLSGYVLTHDIVNKDKELLCIIESILGVDKKRILRRLKEKHNPSTHQLAGGDHGDGVVVTRPAVLVTGGRLYDQLTAQIQELNPKDGSWKEITRMPVTLSHHSVAVKNNVLYVAGGEDTAMAGVRALTSMWSYDPSKNEWETLPDMLHGRAFFCFASLNEHLIAVGGKSSKVIRTSVEKYCILSRRWEFSHCLKQPRFAHAGCVYKHHLYVTGGVVKKSSKVDTMRYNLDANQWQNLAPMRCARSRHCMAYVRDRMYVFGGESESHGVCQPVNIALECYTPLCDQWHKVAQKVPFQSDIECGCAEHGDQIFLIGGCRANLADHRLDVASYDPETDTWTPRNKLPRRLRGTACAVLALR